jgi:GH35 family endo-1,4-beta-xylanase
MNFLSSILTNNNQQFFQSPSTQSPSTQSQSTQSQNSCCSPSYCAGQSKDQFSFGDEQASTASPEKDQTAESAFKLIEAVLALFKQLLGIGGDKESSPSESSGPKPSGQENSGGSQGPSYGSGNDSYNPGNNGGGGGGNNSGGGGGVSNNGGSSSGGSSNEMPSSGASNNGASNNGGSNNGGSNNGVSNSGGSNNGASNSGGSPTGGSNPSGGASGTDSSSAASSATPSKPVITPSEGKYFGYGVNADKFITDKGYRDKVFGDIKASGAKGILTTENLMKPDSMANPANRAKAAEFVKLANEGGAQVRGHTLNWHRQGDPGMAGLQSGDSKAGIARLEDTIGNTMKDVGKGVKTWDVVNEAFNEDGSLRGANSDAGNKNQSLRVIPGDKDGKNDGMEMSYKIARKNSPDAKLMYNDFNLEFNDKKFDAALSKIKDMNARSEAEGGPKLVDGIGFQGHFKASNFSDPQYMNKMREHIREAKEAGLEVQFTEIDIRDDNDITDEAASFGKLLKEEGVDVAEWWNVSDNESWITKEFGAGNHAPTLNNNDGSRKPAFNAFMEAFK